MRRNDGETESSVNETAIPAIPGYKPPAILTVTVFDLIERLEARLTGALKKYYFEHQERIQKALFKALKAKKVELIGNRVLRKTTGSTSLVSNEAIYTYPSLQAAKDAVVNMVADLAMLPPPVEPFIDDAGFSKTTDGPLRAFLARVAGGYATDQDYLYAARLLITHSKKQLPREAVMGAVRTLESYLKPERLTASKASKPDEQDFQIYRREKLGRGSVPLTKTASLNWTYDPKTGYLSLSTKTIDLSEARDAINEAGGNAVFRFEEKGGYKHWYLDISIKEVPFLLTTCEINTPTLLIVCRFRGKGGLSRRPEPLNPGRSKRRVSNPPGCLAPQKGKLRATYAWVNTTRPLKNTRPSPGK